MAEKSCFSRGADTLFKGEHITESQTLISKDGIFELGFFNPGTTSSHNTYLGIWYKDFPKQNVVWVANREHPLPNTSGLSLTVLPNGNLALYHDLDDDPLWSTTLTSALPETVEAVLLDDGNLILRDGSKPDAIFWQSFDHPTHVWLAGAAVGTTQRLVPSHWRRLAGTLILSSCSGICQLCIGGVGIGLLLGLHQLFS